MAWMLHGFQGVGMCLAALLAFLAASQLCLQVNCTVQVKCCVLWQVAHLAVLCCAVALFREAGSMELELEQLKGSVMALIMAANTSAEAEPYRELSDAIVKVPAQRHRLSTHSHCCKLGLMQGYRASLSVCPVDCLRQWSAAIANGVPGLSVVLWGELLCFAVPMLQLINWMLTQADGNSGGAPGQGFKSVGFESFERIWDGGQVGMNNKLHLFGCLCVSCAVLPCHTPLVSSLVTACTATGCWCSHQSLSTATVSASGAFHIGRYHPKQHDPQTMVGYLFVLLPQLLSALSEAGLGAQEVEHLWACYEKAKAAEEKAGFATGVSCSKPCELRL